MIITRRHILFLMAEGKSFSQLLSGETLIKLGWHRDSSVPLKGSKEYAPDGSWIEAKRFDVKLEERKDLLLEERVAKIGALARCEWKPEVGKCEVIKNTRKFWQTMGHSEDGVDYLFPEEAIFLVDTGMLELYYSGLPLTLQQTFSTFIGHHITVEQYQTYSFLSRYGYILRRHDPDRIITEYERQLRIDQYAKLPSKKRKLNPSNRPSPEVAKIKKVIHDLDSKKVERIPHPKTESATVTNDLNTETKEEESSDLSLHVESHRRLRYTKWDWKNIDIPNIADKNTLTVWKPNSELLPCCVQYERDSYTVDKSDFKTKRTWDGEYEFSLGGTSWKSNIKAQNWGEYRIKYQKYLREYSVTTSPAGNLWRGKVQPLVRPQDAKSAADVLMKLQVIESVQMSLPNCSFSVPGEEERPRFKIIYDVYLPNSKFKKTALMSPNHHLCIVNSADPFPSLAEMMALRRKCQAKIPLYFAVVDCGDISFYVFHDVQLPTDTSLK